MSALSDAQDAVDALKSEAASTSQKLIAARILLGVEITAEQDADDDQLEADVVAIESANGPSRVILERNLLRKTLQDIIDARDDKVERPRANARAIVALAGVGT